jgi:cupin fold WbuC family metalloprotein
MTDIAERAGGSVQVIDAAMLDALTARASASPRLRQHRNLHQSYADPCQRLLNAIEPGSYLRPKRDVTVPRIKLLVALRGRFALVKFDDGGHIVSVIPFAAGGTQNAAPAVEVAPDCWGTTVSLASGSVLLEVRPGPFDPAHLGDFAPWAPEAGTRAAESYLAELEQSVRIRLAID